ncbi:MAG: ABC transporter substrate-binding protein [Deltaproteobacteria bacterium]|nr:ABC transporter substrate-binding protein [Deltaproteobacteria bacterium]
MKKSSYVEKSVRKRSVYKVATVSLIWLYIFVPKVYYAYAGSPTEQVKDGIDRIIVILEDKEYRQSHTKEELNNRLQEAAHEGFDWKGIAQRSLGLYWKKRSQEEKKEFTDLFTNLLKKTYTGKLVDNYSEDKVIYDKEIIDGNRAFVATRIVNKEGKEISVGYRLIMKGNNWRVYDIIIEGVSMLKNYRVQFYSIIRQSSYEELVKKLKAKQLKGLEVSAASK